MQKQNRDIEWAIRQLDEEGKTPTASRINSTLFLEGQQWGQETIQAYLNARMKGQVEGIIVLGAALQYNIWRYDPQHDDIHIVDSALSIDHARDIAASRSIKEQKQYEYTLAGGEYEQCLQNKANAIQERKEEEERSIQEQEQQANALIAHIPYLKINKEATIEPYFLYDMTDERPGHGEQCFYNAGIDDLVGAVQYYLEQQSTPQV